MYSNIINNVSKHITLTKDEKQFFTELLTFKKVSKKTILLQQGEICKFEVYIQKGCIRSYYIDEDGLEVTLLFSVEDWWVSNMASFHEQTPSQMIIETMEDCELYIVTPRTKEMLLKKVPKFERFFRIIVQRHLCTFQNRVFHTISKSATDRYLDFLKLYPSIPTRVAQHYIASYLGISAEFLSKIRKRLSEK